MRDWILVIAFAILTACVCVQGWYIKDLREEIAAQKEVSKEIIKSLNELIYVTYEDKLPKR